MKTKICRLEELGARGNCNYSCTKCSWFEKPEEVYNIKRKMEEERDLRRSFKYQRIH